jgi:hypothetical protein
MFRSTSPDLDLQGRLAMSSTNLLVTELDAVFLPEFTAYKFESDATW